MSKNTDLEYYFNKQKDFYRRIKDSPSENLSLAVVIPSYNETKLLQSLQSLASCTYPETDVEVIVVLNASEDESAQIKELHINTFGECCEWSKRNSPDWLKFHFLLESNLPKKHAGVGLARKIGMDEAAFRLFSIGRADAPIACFDADSRCEANYFCSILEHFNEQPAISACSIHFEHPIDGDEYSTDVHTAISYYELHLRVYKQGLEFANAPFAFHTIGSSMAVRVVDYCRQGGMNKRKAGEDFYFLQKFIELGNFSEINSTKVIPSPRASNRVPFGTGRAVSQHISNKKPLNITYHLDSYLILKEFFGLYPLLYNRIEGAVPPKEIIDFVGGETIFDQQMEELRRQSKSLESFKKRFFRWFNAFRTLKFIHFLRDTALQEMKTEEAALQLETLMGVESKDHGLTEILLRYRRRDKKSILR